MLLTRKEFDEKYHQGSLCVAMVGMSNIGKSYRSRQMAKRKGFDRVCVDDSIGQELGFENETKLAHWLNYPYQEGFLDRQSQYLEREGRITKKYAEEATGNFFLDTTGSVIYVDPSIHDFLQENFLIVGLDAAESMIEVMMEEFFVHPKALIWSDMFSQKKGENEIEALRHCYPKLLKDRMEKYRQLSDILIPGELSRSPEISADRFWEILRNTLPKTR